MPHKRYPGGAATKVRYVDAVLTRTALRADGDEARYEIAISSETVVERNFYGLAWREQLDHSAGAVQMGRLKSGRAPFLADHETRTQVGTLTNARVDADRVLRAEVVWGVSEKAKERKAEIDAGTNVGANVSVGYVPKRWKLMEEDADKGDLWLAKLWEPMEASGVAIPADATVGFGRGNEGPGEFPVETEEEDRPMRKKWVMDERGRAVEVDETDPRPELNASQLEILTRNAGAPPAPPPARAGGAVPSDRDRAAEFAEIADFCRANGEQVDAAWIREGLTPDAYALRLLKAKAANGTAQPAMERIAANLTDKERAEYSVARAMAISAGLNPKGSGGIGARAEGLEWDLHREIEKNLPPNFSRHEGGVFVPLALNKRMAGAPVSSGKRTMDSVTGTKGAELVFDRPGDLIEFFRNRSVVTRLGARRLTGLVGPITFPKQTGGMTFYWMPENGGVDVTASDITLGLVTLAPKTVMGASKVSRQLVIQAPSSGIDVENMIRDEFAIGHELEVDRVCLHGTGASGQPTGVFNAPDVQTQSLATVDWASVLAFVKKVAAKNAPADSIGWATTPEAAAKFMTTLKDSVAGARYLWEGTIYDGEMAGFRSMSSNQISKLLGTGAQHGVIAGAWNDMVVGSWGAIEITVDPFTLMLQGLLRVGSFELMDTIVRHGESFCTGVVTP